MCKYCEGKNVFRDTLKNEKSNDIELKIYEYHTTRCTCINDEFTGEDSISINYCPMCGRKLGD